MFLPCSPNPSCLLRSPGEAVIRLSQWWLRQILGRRCSIVHGWYWLIVNYHDPCHSHQRLIALVDDAKYWLIMAKEVITWWLSTLGSWWMLMGKMGSGFPDSQTRARSHLRVCRGVSIAMTYCHAAASPATHQHQSISQKSWRQAAFIATWQLRRWTAVYLTLCQLH